jgi:hypothetical protein
MCTTTGSGKTTIARLYAQFLNEIGIMGTTTNGGTTSGTTASAATTSATAVTTATSNTTAAITGAAAGTGTTAAAVAPTFIQETSGSKLNANDGVKLFNTLLSNILANGGGVLFVDEAYQLTSGSIGGQGKQVSTSTDTAYIYCVCTLTL